jgi:hypothetical protein
MQKSLMLGHDEMYTDGVFIKLFPCSKKTEHLQQKQRKNLLTDADDIDIIEMIVSNEYEMR